VPLSSNQIAALRALSSPSVANAIETFKVRPREAGNLSSEIRAPTTRTARGGSPASRAAYYPFHTQRWFTIIQIEFSSRLLPAVSAKACLPPSETFSTQLETG
jgi:hypothetical protein